MKIIQISKSYGSRRALSNVSIEIPSAGIFGLLGSNGAGKTTLLGILGGLIHCDSGKVEYHRRDISDSNMQMPGVMLQGMSLYPEETVISNIRFLAGLHNAPYHEILDEFGLAEFLRFKAGKLSHGEAKMILIAQAFLNNPKIVLLDEPFSGFDPCKVQFLREIFRRRGSKSLIILSSHNLNEIDKLCSHIAILNQGVVLASGSKKRIKKGRSLETVFIELLKRS